MVGQFRNQTWDSRYEKMGDLAEGKFEEWMNTKRLGYVRYGLDRPPLAMHMLPTRLRYTPDYLASSRFIEVQGYGRDAQFKLKLDKWSSLHWWNDLHPVWFFAYDSYYDRTCFIPLTKLDTIIGSQHTTLQSFAEGKPYFSFSADEIMAGAEEW